MKLGFTGTREALPQEQAEALAGLLARLGPEIKEAHHGDCVGADEMFDRLVVVMGKKRVIHPPLDDRYRAFCGQDCTDPTLIFIVPAKDYIARNHDIVNFTDRMIAVPRYEEDHPSSKRSGTWATVRYAAKQKKPTWVVMPWGEIQTRGMPGG